MPIKALCHTSQIPRKIVQLSLGPLFNLIYSGILFNHVKKSTGYDVDKPWDSILSERSIMKDDMLCDSIGIKCSE